MKIVVTGATGYVGARFLNIGVAHGHIVVAASRRPPFNQAGIWIPFDIASPNFIELPTETAAILHLAFNSLSSNSEEEMCEVNAAINLIKLAKEVGAKFIFVSSQTARSDAPTAYGRTKWRIEQLVLSAGGWVVRPGQVYGGELRGLFGMLVASIRKLPILPAFVPAPKIQPIHVDDLVDGLLRITERTDLPSGVYCLAASEAVSFSTFLGEIAESRLRCWRGFVPVPVVVINVLACALGKALRTQLGLERLRSLFDLPAMETSSDLSKLGLILRPLHSGMHPSGSDSRRRLLQEGQSLLTYVLKKPATGSLLRRYARVIERLRGGRALGLPKVFLKHPILLALIDKTTWADKPAGEEYIWRLDTATMLAEATSLGAYSFLGFGRVQGALTSLISLAVAVVCEVLWRLARVLFCPLIHLAMRSEKGVL